MAGRRTDSFNLGLGDVVTVPPLGKFPGGRVTVDRIGKRYFSGVTPTGQRLRRTGIGLVEGQKLGSPAEPWNVERRGSIGDI